VSSKRHGVCGIFRRLPLNSMRIGECQQSLQSFLHLHRQSRLIYTCQGYSLQAFSFCIHWVSMLLPSPPILLVTPAMVPGHQVR